MTTYDNNQSGALFKNDKQGVENRPDYRGSAEVDRVQYWVSAWIKTSNKDGSKFMSLKFQPKQAAEVKGAPKNPPAKQPPLDEWNDEIPF